MRPIGLLLAGTAAAAAGLAGSAGAQMGHGGGGAAASVAILASSYAPEHVDVVAGEEVHWDNASVLRHSVTADDDSFASGQLFGGDMYMHRFERPGAVAYHCTVHPGMRGVVDVHRVLLTSPRETGAPGRPYVLRGRSSLPAGSAVGIERDTGEGFARIASATTRDDGSFAAGVRAPRTAHFRAVLGDGEASPGVRLLVVDRSVAASVGRGVVRARVAPASPGATVVLQLRLRERFGWWPVRRARLDGHSRVRFAAPVKRGTRARVVLTLDDGATVLARSPVVTVRPAR